jgi:hydroxypyruvate isomerase
MHIMEGVTEERLRAIMPIVRHIQIADAPGRHEPGTGEMGFPEPLRMLERLGYQGWIGCEYIPATSTFAGLDWARPYLDHA